jgi:hypothetical protein
LRLLRSEIVDFVRMYLPEYPQDVAELQEIHIHELDVSCDGEFLQPGEVQPGTGPDRAENTIVPF